MLSSPEFLPVGPSPCAGSPPLRVPIRFLRRLPSSRTRAHVHICVDRQPRRSSGNTRSISPFKCFRQRTRGSSVTAVQRPMRFLFFSTGCQPHPPWSSGTALVAPRISSSARFSRRHGVPRRFFPRSQIPLTCARAPRFLCLHLARRPSPFRVVVDASPVRARWLPRPGNDYFAHSLLQCAVPAGDNTQTRSPRISVTSHFLHPLPPSHGEGVRNTRSSLPTSFLQHALTSFVAARRPFTGGSRALRIFILLEMNATGRHPALSRWPSDARSSPIIPVLFHGVVGFLNRPPSYRC